MLRILFLAALCLLGKKQLEQHLAGQHSRRPAIKMNQLAFDSGLLARYTLGFQNFIAALTWVDLLQRADHRPLQQDEVSWEYLQLRTITQLDRAFTPAYQFGSVFLSVLRNDKQGAKALLERWVKLRPNAWQPNYLMAHHLYFELHDYAAAAPFMLKAASLEGAPAWLPALGVRLLSETHSTAEALRLSLDLYSQYSTPAARERLTIRIRHLNFQLQKLYYEEQLRAYRTKLGTPPPSMQALEAFAQQNPFRTLAQAVEDPDLQRLLAERFAFTLEHGNLTPRETHLRRDWATTGVLKNPGVPN